MITLTVEQREAIRALCHDYQVTRLELFGSAAREDFDPERSDVDVLVEFAPGTDFGPWMARFFELREQLAAVLGRPVDLLMVGGVRSPRLLRAIEQDRRVLYAA